VFTHRTFVANGRDPVRRGDPFPVPVVNAAVADVLDGRDAFVEVGAAVDGQDQRAVAERLPHRVVTEEWPHRSRLLPGRWGGVLGRRALHRGATEERGSAQTACAHGAAASEPLLSNGP
jgi:hypothetical protein